MTFPPDGPPPEDYPDDDRPQGPPPSGYRSSGHPPSGYPPSGYLPPGPPPGYRPPGPLPGYQPYGQPYRPPPQPNRRIDPGLAFVGTLLYFVLNFVVGFGAFGVAGSTADSVNTIFAGTAVMLVLIAFGGGALLLRTASPNTRGLGLGLMIGWAVTSLVTVGFCTGINPALYTT